MSTNSNETVHVVGICGSLRTLSYTRMAVRIALQGAAAHGATTRLIDLRDYDLVFCDGSHKEAERAPDVTRLRQAVRDAQGIILGTPDYHGSFSGVLKNALDLMGFAEFEGKVLGLVAVAGGAAGSVNALNNLRVVGRSLHAWVVPEQVSIPRAHSVFQDDGTLKDAGLHQRLEEVGHQVARFAFLHSSRQAQSFLQAWESAIRNPGATGQ